MASWQEFSGLNRGFVLELYEKYRQDPASVDPETRAVFEQWTPPAEDRGQRVADGLAGELTPSGEHLQQNDAERPDVASLVDRFPARLFRRHVRSRAEDHAGARHRPGHGRRVGRQADGFALTPANGAVGRVDFIDD